MSRAGPAGGKTAPQPTVAPDFPARVTANGLRIFVRLAPKSASDGIEGLGAGPNGPHLKLRVRALPEDGAANAAAHRLVAESMDVPRQAVRLASGATSRYKAFDIAGDPRILSDRLAGLISKHG